MELPKRKNIRLKHYDYSSNGAYFLTICVKDGQNLFGEIAVGGTSPAIVFVKLNAIGDMIKTYIENINTIYNDITVQKYVVMPNHIHMLVTVDCEGGRTMFAPTEARAPTMSRVVKQFKGAITKQMGYSIWQRSYYDRVIRTEAEYQYAWQYIDENPAKWEEDRHFVGT